MDVLGKNPSSETGKHFGRDVWTWHPLVLEFAAFYNESGGFAIR
jgi:hypothetical protein